MMITNNNPEPLCEDNVYKMISSIAISNFQCFRQASLNGLKPINIIVGENAAGKTALLEALYIAARASPHALMFINQLRGTMPTIPLLPGIAPEQFSAFWDHFFTGFDTNQTISFDITDSNFGQHKLRIFYADDKQVQLPILPQTGGKVATSRPLTFERLAGNDKTLFSLKLNLNGQLSADLVPDFGPAAALFGSTLSYAQADNSVWWSQLSLSGEDKNVIDTLHEEFPAIEDIKLLSPFGPFSTAFYARNSFTADSMLPLQLVSSGINKLFTLLLATASFKNGIILIDEIENGIHYSKYAHIWTILRSIATKTNCQIFASTHSREALEAALPSLGEFEDDFCLIRASKDSGGTALSAFTGKELRTTIQQEREVR